MGLEIGFLAAGEFSRLGDGGLGVLSDEALSGTGVLI